MTDLGGRHRLEDDMARALASHPELILARRATQALDALDFTMLGPGERLARVELKAKHQLYRGWAQLRPELAERDLFILLTAPTGPVSGGWGGDRSHQGQLFAFL